MEQQNIHATQQREFPHTIAPDIEMWSTYAEEKELYFNGYAVNTANGLIIIDPPAAGEAIFKALYRLGEPRFIVVTNADHERESDAFRRRFHIPVISHRLDAPRMTIKPEHTVEDGNTIADTLQVIHLPNQKTPGEMALFWAERRLLFLGDALIGKPAGQLRMLPDEKYTDASAARQSLTRLIQLIPNVGTVLPGDGEPILQQAGAALQQFFQ